MNEMITAALYQERRLALMEQMDEKSVVLLFSGKTIMRSADEEYPFSVDAVFIIYAVLTVRIWYCSCTTCRG